MENKDIHNDFIDFILSDEKEVYDNGLSHPSVEFENQERKV